MTGATIVLFRNDLRIADHPALTYASSRELPIIPLFIWSPEEDGEWQPGAASRWWLHQSLTSLKEDLKKFGLQLIIAKEDSCIEATLKVIEKTGADAVCWSRRYEPNAIAVDRKLKTTLKNKGIEARSFVGNLLFEPWTIATASGTAYKVYTPFWRACLEAQEPHLPLGVPENLRAYKGKLPSLKVSDLDLEPQIDWAGGLKEFWTPGETGAKKRLDRFINQGLGFYQVERDRPDHDGVSYLSPHLHFGEISPRQIWHGVQQALIEKASPEKQKNAQVYLKEIVWREFANNVLFHFPSTVDKPLRENFQKFPWSNTKEKQFEAWTKGMTGYPIVDAGMRQLWVTGWMHNRVRMIVASFLTKDLLISWREGAKWFFDTLVDADLASNTFGWQWTAGCGADAAPFFRIFNPVLQGKKFDPDGEYVRKWVPELANASNKWIHEPWTTSFENLQKAGITLGANYPEPIVDHGLARKRALEIFSSIK